MELKEPYQKRSIRFLELFQRQGWQLKIYSILHQDKKLKPQLIEAAKEAALAFLPQPAQAPSHYGLGFISVHQGKSYDFVTVAYWTYDTELRHQTYMRPSSASVELEVLTASELSTDVWDLRVLAFERDAWVKAILDPARPDPAAYVQLQLTEMV
jgi:uncharacterized protein (DUF1684 family)